MTRIVVKHQTPALPVLTRLALAVLTAGTLVLHGSATHAAGTPEQQCQATKNKTAGKYASCRQAAEAKLATSEDVGRYNDAIAKCDTKFASAWQKAIDKAAAVSATCLDAPLTEGDFQAILAASSDNIADALAGLGLTDCSADLATCAGDLGTCTGDLAVCATDLTQATGGLTNCNGTVTTLTDNLSICNGGLTTCNGSLGTCTSSLTTANANLSTCTGSLGTCTIDLGQATSDLATCEGDLVTCEACGNGTVETPEQCDGAALGGATCATQGFALGTLRCASGCTFDTSDCFPTRYVDNGDGTVTDRATNLQWEKKQNSNNNENLADLHDADNKYSWTVSGPLYPANGTVFTDFLAKLNNGMSTDGVTLTGCFAGHCDWRLPTIVELRTILLESFPCGTNPCIPPVFGPVPADFFVLSDYWSSTTYASLDRALGVRFTDGSVDHALKTSIQYVRAVRTVP